MFLKIQCAQLAITLLSIATLYVTMQLDSCEDESNRLSAVSPDVIAKHKDL
jgi:hypothetical protein